MIFPWQVNEWQQLLQINSMQRLSHALLLTGTEGIGKAHFAEEFARFLLCPSLRSGSAAIYDETHQNECHICCLVFAKTHSDILWVSPSEEGHAIKVDQIRELKEFINQSSLQGEYRIVLINFAHQMNINAANALLKTLEEPTLNSLLMLMTDQPSRLPATILSRCQRVHFPKPNREIALNWLHNQKLEQENDLDLLLKLANGGPLAAINIAQQETLKIRRDFIHTLDLLSNNLTDPLKAQDQFMDFVPQILKFTMTLMIDLVALQWGKEENEIINSDYADSLIAIAKRSNANDSIKFIEFLVNLQRYFAEGFNLNKQLVVENILLRWMDLFHVSC